MCHRCVRYGRRLWHIYDTQPGYYERTDKSVYPKRTLRLHRQVWEDANGPIPDGWHVHHIDEDITNNDISNLQCLPMGDHLRVHATGRPKSEAEIAGMRQRMLEAWAAVEPVDVVCSICGTAFQSRVMGQEPRFYCSDVCKERLRSTRFEGEDRTCDMCRAPYRATKRAQRYCGKRCNYNATMARSRTLAERDVICAHCSTTFRSRRANARFCRHECALAFHHERRFERPRLSEQRAGLRPTRRRGE